MSLFQRAASDKVLIAFALILSMFGIAMVYSAGQTDVASGVRVLYQRQFLWLLVAIGAAWVANRASVRFLEWAAWPAYLATLAILALTLVVGTGAGTAASSKSWISIGGHRIGQPSEFAKIAVVIMLAHVLSQRKEPPASLLELWKPLVVMGIPCLLILKQPDLGTAMVLVGVVFAMLFWAGVRWQLLLLLASPGISLLLASNTGIWGAWFLILIALVIWYRPYVAEGVILVVANVATGVIGPLLWERIQPHQRERLLVFLEDPSIDPSGAGYQVVQSKVAIGSGGWFGTGFTQGPQKRLDFLPEQHTDFIFAVIGEELGFIGVTVALALFLALFLRCTRIATRANEPFSSLIAFGLMASWLVHVLVNVGMTINLMPITGIPLPFFSYGGSFLVASWLAVGILLRVSMEGRGRGDILSR
jgi:rod shape determining protein RodA